MKKYTEELSDIFKSKAKLKISEKVIDVMVDKFNQIHITSFSNHDFDGILKSENNDLKHVTYNTDGFLL